MTDGADCRFMKIRRGKYLYAVMLAVAMLLTETATAQIFTPQLPIYIVNGQRMSEEQVREIEPEDILTNTLLPADEQTIEKYGPDASNGVIVISLRYDTPARFEVDGEPTSFSNYIAQQIKWGEMDPIAQVVMELTVGADGRAVESEVLDSSDRRLLNRVRNAIEEAPLWVAAKKDGQGVQTKHILRVTLPIGSTMPRERVIRIR